MKPTVGRQVHYYEDDESGPYAATVTKVHTEECVNLAVLRDYTQSLVFVTSVTPRTGSGWGWEWPPRV